MGDSRGQYNERDEQGDAPHGDGATFQLRDAEAEAVLAGLQTSLGEPDAASSP
jgi:hypothetical protein